MYNVADLSRKVKSPFFKLLVIVANTHEWIQETEKRKKWSFRVFVGTLAIEIQVHWLAVQHWGESRYWWEMIPILGKILELIFK